MKTSTLGGVAHVLSCFRVRRYGINCCQEFVVNQRPSGKGEPGKGDMLGGREKVVRVCVCVCVGGGSQ